MEKFTLIQEAIGRIHGGGNPFSNGHRSRKYGDGFLLSHFMLDLDEVIYDDNNNVIAIIEKKYQAHSRKLGNILLEPTMQKKVLLELSRLLGCKIFVNITSEDKYYRIDSLTESKEFTSESFEKSRTKYKTYNSDDVLYIEYGYRSGGIIIKALIKRVGDNININGLMGNITTRLNIPLVKVDDTGSSIKFYKSDGVNNTLVGEVDSVLVPKDITDNVLRTELENKWEEIYRNLGIW